MILFLPGDIRCSAKAGTKLHSFLLLGNSGWWLNRLPREAATAPNLSEFKERLDALSHIV